VTGAGETDLLTAGFDLVPALTAPLYGRRLIRELLNAWNVVDVDATETAALVASELVTNAILRSGGTVHLAVQMTAERLQVSVTDHDSAPPAAQESGPLSSNGRGVAVVEALSLRWGVDSTSGGTRVWVDVARGADRDRTAGRR
jgi:anti-sigma regulatory factor (Ser/Thr protein kinase)